MGRGIAITKGLRTAGQGTEEGESDFFSHRVTNQRSKSEPQRCRLPAAKNAVAMRKFVLSMSLGNQHIKSGQDLGPNPLLGPHEYCSSTLELKNLPLGSPLRLKVGVSKELPALEGLFRRLDLRFRRGVKGIPLNPFNKSSRLRLYSKEAPTVSEEFIEPQANQ